MATDDEIYRAERAKSLLADDAFATALTELKMEALLALADADATKFSTIAQLQADVRALDGLKAKLEAAILRTGVHDGGLTMKATRKANTAAN